ncbi:MAG: RES family NAD+ phosphorylase [Proteobacteria bacterium]|nr:RES family NAD+ phosphorylase [Pseudomonadota bacterium]
MKPPRVHSPTVLLEHGTLADLKKAKTRQAEYERYYWDYHFALQYQRDKVKDQIFEVLNAACSSAFSFSAWQRSVKYRYGLHPLCVIGSLVEPGGRFNFGDFNPQTFEPFPALYVAEDKSTAIAEHLLGEAERESSTAWDQALTKSTSITIVSVSGSLEKVFDVRQAATLRSFVKLIAAFTVPDSLKLMARRLGLAEPLAVKTAKALKTSLEDKKWRRSAMLFDVPSNPQIFGHLIYSSKIEAVLYRSVITAKDCLAIYPRNFAETTSYIQLDDTAPIADTPTRLDAQTWGVSEVAWKDL